MYQPANSVQIKVWLHLWSFSLFLHLLYLFLLSTKYGEYPSGTCGSRDRRRVCPAADAYSQQFGRILLCGTDSTAACVGPVGCIQSACAFLVASRAYRMVRVTLSDFPLKRCVLTLALTVYLSQFLAGTCLLNRHLKALAMELCLQTGRLCGS